VTARAAGVAISELPSSQLAAYAAVPIALRVTSRLVRDPASPTADALVEVPVARPFDKDYDAAPGLTPLRWRERFALEQWGLFVAEVDGRVVGGAAVAPAPEVMPELDLSASTGVLWDLRVAPAWQGRGVGSALFRAGQRWAGANGYRTLVVETQDINVAACRFYARMGCRLLSFHEQAYDTMPGEARLVWGVRALNDCPTVDE
jgi:GNAT superfamily N-acetyltransferase